MGTAMLRGWLASGIAPEQFAIVDPLAGDLPQGVELYRSAAELNRKFDVVMLGIKPQMLETLAADIARLVAPDAVVISILAGAPTRTLASFFPDARILRLMPNLAAAIGKSPMGLFSSTLDDAERLQIDTIVAPLGSPIWLTDEAQMDAVTALAGSGPAFIYRFIDALTRGGAATGLPKDVADKLALAMIEGAVLLAAASSESPAQLAARVTSPGGTTAAGLAVLDRDQALDTLIENTLRAARDRGLELAKGDIT